MKKIEKKMVEAIRNLKRFSEGNTVFVNDNPHDGWGLYLHGNKIATFDAKRKNHSIPTAISLAGWPSHTTCSRLRALDGINICIKDGIPYLNGKEIDCYGWFPVFPVK